MSIMLSWLFLLSAAGHYVAFAKNTLRNSWYEFNDTRVYPVSSDTVLNAEGYVLFYRYDWLSTPDVLIYAHHLFFSFRRAVSSDSHLVDITSLVSSTEGFSQLFSPLPPLPLLLS